MSVALTWVIMGLLATAGTGTVLVATGPPSEIPGPPNGVPAEGPPNGFPGQAPDLPEQACAHMPDLDGVHGNVPDWVDLPAC